MINVERRKDPEPTPQLTQKILIKRVNLVTHSLSIREHNTPTHLTYRSPQIKESDSFDSEIARCCFRGVGNKHFFHPIRP